MIRAVIDTNIFIRALIRPLGTVGPVIPRLAQGEYVAIYSLPMRDELIAKLALPRIRRKYQVTDAEVDAWLSLLALRAALVEPTRRVKVCRDPDDDMLIEAALAGQATLVVTGDDDLLVLDPFETVHFVTPWVFLQELDRQQSSLSE